jgi:AraC family transcriptional regulator of adaptative response/methylated-DNA-[protein]-cysteine methyltransferase
MTRRRKVTVMDITTDSRWNQLVARDKSADGEFFYSVATTGVYCRPSCGARTPLPKNVAFYRTTQEAERAGFRACKRCKPNAPPLAQVHAAIVADLCRFIEEAESAPKLEELAERSGLSPFHLHRVFKEVTGVTPRAYAAAARAKKMRASLDRSGSVTEAVYDAGYSSSSRFYETSNAILGMTPKRWRAGGEGMTIRFAVGECSLGSILVAASERGICAVTLGDDPDALAKDLQDRFPRAELVPGDRGFERVVAKVIAFVDAPKKGLDLPLDVQGTAFQERVWKALQLVPFGQTTSYGEIARRIGAPRAVRAVATACGENRLAVVIPCHRVVTVAGGLAGYRWGIERKRALLDAESSKKRS